MVFVTIDAVLSEFLMGAADEKKYAEKQLIINGIVDEILPTTRDMFVIANDLLKEYKEDGKSLSITDLLLGAFLKKYKQNIFLMTKNTTDFPTNIFTLKTYLLLSHKKALQAYGVYSYEID